MLLKPHVVKESNIRLAGEGKGMRAQFYGKVEISVRGYGFNLFIQCIRSFA